MSGDGQRNKASEPDDLNRFFLERANADDVEGLVALYEPDAVLALPTGELARGRQAIRQAFVQLLAHGPTFTRDGQRPPLHNGDLALTSTRLSSGATAEIARRQPDGTWLWAVDQTDILGTSIPAGSRD